jgi:molybdate transport system regulatory protein
MTNPYLRETMTTETTFSSGKLCLTSSQGGDLSARRIALLEAIGELGSIASAAKQLGMSYRSAWDAVDEMNNMWETPLVAKSPGGSHGGGTQLTPQGRDLIASFKLMQQEYRRFTDGLTRNLGKFNLMQQSMLRLSMRTSARNQFQGKVEVISLGEINSEITLAINERVRLTASITSESVESLGLTLGSEAYALIKASFIILIPNDDKIVTSARNRLCGIVRELRHGSISSEAIIELDGGKTLAAVITKESAQASEFQCGSHVCALVKASHIILGVN